jgi:uncharacterized protein DUF6473
MKYDRIIHGSLDYCLYRFGKSQSLFRGPKPDLSRPYCVFLGSSESFGKFVPQPFSRLLQRKLGLVCANFASHNAGVGFYLNEPCVVLASHEARLTVLAVTGAQNLSNRFYSVHPRRNDRLVNVSGFLRTLFPGLDTCDIHFTRHLLEVLADMDAMRFDIVVQELKIAWLARMKTLLTRISGRTVLLWMADQTPPDPTNMGPRSLASGDPLFVDQAMIDEISPLVTRVVEYVASDQAVAAGADGMMFTAAERVAARQMPGVKQHHEVANLLGGVLRGMV